MFTNIEALLLKIMSYNIENGGLERLSILCRMFQQHQPDVVALLEATNQHVIGTLAQQGAMHVIYGDSNTDAPIAWLSRFPIITRRNHRLPIFSKTLLEIAVMWNNHPLVLFATHLVHGRTKASEGRRSAEVRALLDIMSNQQMFPHLLVGDFNAVHPRDLLGIPPRILRSLGGPAAHPKLDGWTGLRDAGL